jgi:8-oxo-dGTP pyrophosphatase MutT (NUDIX family)
MLEWSMAHQDCSEFEAIRRRLRAQLEAADDAVSAEAKPGQAAVALVLRNNVGAADLLVIKRAIDPRDHWSGHLALPGGRRDPDDSALSFTAVRETREEVGMDLAAGGQILGRLEAATPRSTLAPQLIVTPYVAVAPPAYHILEPGDEGAALTLSPEVEAAFWVPISLLMRNGPSEVFRLIGEDEEREWPAYATEHGLIWGMTERILTSFLRLLR